MRRRRRNRVSLARYAAPVAFLAALTIAILIVRSSLSSGDNAGSTGTAATRTARATAKAKAKAKAAAARTARRTTPVKRPKRRFYVIESGDTFGTVAVKFGTSVEALQALNPRVSSNSLSVGQRIRVK